MNRTELHPIEVLILAVLLTAEALLTLAVAGVALVGALLPEPARPAPAAPPAPPAMSPLLLTLEGLTCAQLRPLAGVTSKRHRKAELIDLAGVAMAC